MYTWYSPPDDIGWSEQVLGWDDIYTADHWQFLSEAERLFVILHPDPDMLLENGLATLVRTIASTRREMDDYRSDGPEPGED